MVITCIQSASQIQILQYSMKYEVQWANFKREWISRVWPLYVAWKILNKQDNEQQATMNQY